LSPVYNESFSFIISPDKIEEVQLMATVVDYDLMKSNDEIGYVILGMNGNETGQKHWKEMITRPGYPSAMWHPLLAKW